MTATEPSSSTRTRSRGVLILIGCVVLVCIAWSAAWVYAANRVEKEVDLWIEREAKLGRNWSCTERGLAGFPFRLALNCREPVLETTSGEPVRVTMAAAQVDAHVWSPNSLTATFTAPARIENRTSGEVFGAAWQALQVDASGLTAGRPESIAITAQDPRLELLDTPDGNRPLVSAGRITFSADIREPQQKTPGRPDNVFYSASLTGGRSPMLSALDEAGPIDMTAKGLVTAAANLNPMPLDQRLRAWAASEGVARLDELTITAPAIAASAKGLVGLNPQGELNGALELSFAGIQDLVNRLGTAGIIPRDLTPIIGALAMVGRPTEVDGRKGVSFPLSFQNGTLRLSGMPVGRMPPAF